MAVARGNVYINKHPSPNAGAFNRLGSRINDTFFFFYLVLLLLTFTGRVEDESLINWID